MSETDPRPRRVLLTGATGFVGRQIHAALLRQGHDVVPVIRVGTAARLVDGGRGRRIETPDLFGETRAWWRDASQGVETVVHAAWFVDPTCYLAAPDNLACVAGSLALAQGATDAGVGHLVGVGTCFEYRLPNDRITIDSPLAPTTLYAASKLALFHMLSAFLATRGTTFSWARLFYLFGEGEHPNRLVPHIRGCLERGAVAALSIGTQVRDFLDVRVAGEMIATLVATRQPGAINICSGEHVTVRQLAERIADEYGRRDLLQFGTAPLRPTDPPAVVGVCNLEIA